MGTAARILLGRIGNPLQSDARGDVDSAPAASGCLPSWPEGARTVELYDVIASRHCVREFRRDAVPRDVLERIVVAAASSPSSQNEQPWRFYVTTGDSRHELGKIVAQTTVYLTEYIDVLGPEGYERAMSWFSSLGDAPVLIAIASPESDSDFKQVNRLLSVGASMENLLLAAREEGLGACPFTFSYWVRDEISELLGIEEGHSVISLIAIGWPTEGQSLPPEKRADVAVWLD